MKKYDVLVVGSGPGGYETAIRCAQNGLSVALAEERELGGTCLNRGCIPTKALLHCAESYYNALHPATGISVKGVMADAEKIYEFKDSVVMRLSKGISALESANGVDVIAGRAVLIGKNAVRVGDKLFCADKIVLAVGSRPMALRLPGFMGKRTLNSDAVLNLRSLPKSLVIIGGGVVSLEFATFFSRMGAEVSILELQPEIMPNLDREIRACLIKNTTESGKVKIITDAKVVSAVESENSICVRYELAGKEECVTAEYCVCAIGRTPCTDNIGLESAGVKTENGYVCVNESMQTNIAGIYAIGDITGKIQLSHAAVAQGMICADSICGGNRTIDYNTVPTCVYSVPEIASVGLSEQAAKNSYANVRTGLFDCAGNGRSMIEGSFRGMAKLIVNDDTGEILGAQICSPRATDIISEIAAVMQCEGTVEELSSLVHPHPTISEMWGEAANDVYNRSCNKMPKARRSTKQ